MKNPWPEHVAPTVHEDEYFCYTCGDVHKENAPCACEIDQRQLEAYFDMRDKEKKQDR